MATIRARFPLPPSEKDFLRRVGGVFARPQDAEQYLYDAWERMQVVLSWIERLASAGARDVLELGANPYYLTLLLRRHFDLRLTLANYFGDRSLGERGDHTVVIGGERVTLPYDHFNLESEPFPYAERTFDLVLFCDIVEHLVLDPGPALSEIARILRPGGHLVVTTPNAARLGNLVRLLKGRNIYAPYSPNGPYGRHNREYTLDELVRRVERAGLRIVDEKVRNIYPHPLRSRLLQSLRPRVWREHLFVLARREA